jgi:hypothetical protein
MDRNRLVAHALAQPANAVRRTLAESVRATFSGEQVVVEFDEYQFDEILELAAKGRATVTDYPGFSPDFHASLDESNNLSVTRKTGWFELEVAGEKFEVVVVHLQGNYRQECFCLLTARNLEKIEELLRLISDSAGELTTAVQVFQDGCWSPSNALRADIQLYTLENLVQPAGRAEALRSDIQHWLDSRETYERYGIPWKRGLIFAGPPGNGKTHTIKALLNHFAINVLYVRSFSSRHGSDSNNIRQVFNHARQQAPCFLILEDLDTLITPKNRSYFLNELDGFARNQGILTIASANDPEKLDPALADRPSRFDRTYVFELPAFSERATYLRRITGSFEEHLRLDEETADEVAAVTEEFSYAYLKELVLSSMMSWVAEPHRPFREAILANVYGLRTQMSANPITTIAMPMDDDAEDEDED